MSSISMDDKVDCKEISSYSALAHNQIEPIDQGDYYSSINHDQMLQ